jgi:putative oxidoreductase
MSRVLLDRSTHSWRMRGVWLLRIIVALLLFYEGIDKFSTSRLWATVFSRIGFGSWFRYATGAVEVIGSILLLIPRTTTLAVGLLACTMVGALLTHLFVIGVGPQSVVVLMLLGALLVIGWRGRA